MPSVVHLAALSAPHVGGVETHLARVNQVLVKRGFEVTVITQQHERSLPLQENRDGMQIIRLPMLPAGESLVAKTRYKLHLWRQLAQHLKVVQQADVIQIHDVFFWLLPFLPALDRSKLFMTFHGYEGTALPNSRQMFWHRQATRFTTANLCIGGFHEKWYQVRPTEVAFGGVNSKLLQTAKKNPKKSKKNLIYVGRLAEDNGILKYLEALRLVGKGYTLDVFGDGELLLTAETFAKNHRLPVTFHGAVSNAAERLPQYSLACVTRYLSILEALAAGVPVVAQSNNELQYDYLTQTPFIDSIKVCQTAEEIVNALADPPKITATTSAWVRHQTWENLATTYQELWQL